MGPFLCLCIHNLWVPVVGGGSMICVSVRDFCVTRVTKAEALLGLTLKPQSHFMDTLLKLQVCFPPNETAVMKGINAL